MIRPRSRDALRVLMYHRVDDPARTPGLDPALVSATPSDFRRQMEHLARSCHVVSLEDVLKAFRGGTSLPRRAVLITFDDAYVDFGEHAWPVLRDLGLPAVLFVPTAYPGNHARAFWWDRLHRLLVRWEEEGTGGGDDRGAGADLSWVRGRLKLLAHGEVEEVVDDLTRAWSPAGRSQGHDEGPAVLGWDEIRELAAEGVSIGAHTRRHPPLTRGTDEQIREEVRGSLEDLRRELGEVAPAIAYPYGFHDDRVVRIAREEGFELGFTCLDGLNHAGATDPLRLCRTNITRNTTPLLFRLRILPWFAAVDRWRHRGEPSAATESEASVDALRRELAGVLSETEGGRR